MTEKLSLVVPCFNEEETIEIFYREALNNLEKINAEAEFCFVDDGSRDRTLSILRELHNTDPRVHYISFSRNFGKEAALLAGLEMASGDYICTMDVDLQDPPSLLPEMWRILHEEEGLDSVATRRISRAGEPPMRSWFARRFYRLINRLSHTEIVDGARDFRMMSRMMVNAVISDREYNRFSKGIFSWVGFSTKWLSYENVERSAGSTKWSFWHLFAYAIDGILAYSTVPLMIASFIGVFFFIISLAGLLFIVVRALIFSDPVAGWPSLVSIILFLGSLQLLCMGVMSMYISKIYLETKKRQIYIIKERK